MNKIKLLEWKNEFGGNSYIPSVIWDYFENMIENNKNNSFLAALNIKSLNIIFETASETCGISPDKLAKYLGFNSKDMGDGRFEAFIAEARIINILAEWKFQNIKPLKPKNGRSCDISCERNNCFWVVEVFHTSKNNERWPEDKLIRYYYGRAIEKKGQLDLTAKRLGCNKKIFALVLDSKEAKMSGSKEDFYYVVNRVADYLSWNSAYHFMLSTGWKSLTDPDEVIFPSLL